MLTMDLSLGMLPNFFKYGPNSEVCSENRGIHQVLLSERRHDMSSLFIQN
jgi:hypothetical protein